MEPLEGRRYWGKERVRMANGRIFYTWGRRAEERDHSQWDTTDGGANPGLDHHHRMLGGEYRINHVIQHIPLQCKIVTTQCKIPITQCKIIP